MRKAYFSVLFSNVPKEQRKQAVEDIHSALTKLHEKYPDLSLEVTKWRSKRTISDYMRENPKSAKEKAAYIKGVVDGTSIALELPRRQIVEEMIRQIEEKKR